MSYRCESILDHIADYYLKFISKAQSFWFTLNTSYDHGCHLASRFRLEPNDYKVLLIVAGLASYSKLGFAIKPTAWREFLGGHRFAVDNSYDHGGELCNLVAATRGNNKAAARQGQRGKIADATINSR